MKLAKWIHWVKTKRKWWFKLST